MAIDTCIQDKCKFFEILGKEQVCPNYIETTLRTSIGDIIVKDCSTKKTLIMLESMNNDFLAFINLIKGKDVN